MEGSLVMKKAVVVGGSNGIGLAITQKLIVKNYHVYILDKAEPDEKVISNNGQFTYFPCNLLDFPEDLFESLSKDEAVEVLMITAGFGRVSNFEYYHLAEIQNTLQVNTVAGIKIIRYFYDKIKSPKLFYCGMMGSIAGLISSPLFSVYAASKAAIYRFIESVNIELEVSGTKNRIMNVSPASVNGTKFNGGANDPTLTNKLAEEIVQHLLSSDEIFIPEYEDIYKNILEHYKSDPHEYGLHSYEYKIHSGRIINHRCVCIGYLSGTFDLFHVGHLNLLKRAKQHCDYLIVGVHPSAAHKGKETFIPFAERISIVSAIKYVDKVVQSCPEDSDAWNQYHYDKLFVGSDYKGSERFKQYEKFFAEKGVEIVYFPYTQGTNSTQIRKTVLLKTNDIKK